MTQVKGIDVSPFPLQAMYLYLIVTYDSIAHEGNIKSLIRVCHFPSAIDRVSLIEGIMLKCSVNPYGALTNEDVIL